MTALEAFNALDNREVSRKEVEQVLTQAKAENNTAIIYRLSRVLNDSPEATHFEITITHYDSPVGLSGVQHTGDYREALDDCGRLRKGWKFVKGNVVKVEEKPKKEAKPKKEKAPQKEGKNIENTVTLLHTERFKDDLSYDALERSYSWISFDPEKRAKREQQDWADSMEQLYNSHAEQAQQTGALEAYNAAFEKGYSSLLKNYKEMISIRSRTFSTAITGGAGITARKIANNESLMQREYEKLKIHNQEVKKLKNKLAKIAKNTPADQYETGEVVKSVDVNAIAKLQDKIKQLEEKKEYIYRQQKAEKEYKKSKDSSVFGKYDIKKEDVEQMLDEINRYGYALYSNPANINAEIRRIRERITGLEKNQNKGEEDILIEGGKIVKNGATQRLQIFFDGIPDKDVREKLKRHAFKWAPSVKAWQRTLTPNAIWDVEHNLLATGILKKQGLSGVQHTGDYREALDDCGRLRKGWKFVKGNVVKVEEKPKKEAKPKKEKAPQKETKKDKKYKFVVITDYRPSRVIAVFSYTNPNIEGLREIFWKNGEGKYYETTEEGLRNYAFGMGAYPFEKAKKHIEEKYIEGKDFIYFSIEEDGGRNKAISLVEKPKKEAKPEKEKAPKKEETTKEVSGPKVKDFEAFDDLQAQLLAENADIPKSEVLDFLYNFTDAFEEGKTVFRFWNTPGKKPTEAVLQYKKHPLLTRLQNPSAKMRTYELTPRGYELLEKFHKGVERIKKTYDLGYIAGIHKLSNFLEDRKTYTKKENVEDSSKKKVEKASDKATKSLKSRKGNGEKEGEQKELDLYMQEMKMAIKESKAGKFDKKNILSWLSKFPDKVKGLLYNFLYHHYLLDQEEAKLRKSKKLVPFGLISVQAGINEFVSKLLDLEREDFFDLYFFFRDNMDECIELLEDKEVKKNYYEKKKKGLSGVDYSQGLFGAVPEVSTERFKQMSVRELRVFTLKYYELFLKGDSVTIEKHLKEVVFISSAGRKIARGEAMYSAKAAVIAHLKTLIKNSTYNNWGDRKDSDGKDVLGYLNFKSKLTIDGEKRHVRISLVVYRDRKTELKNVEVGKKKSASTSKATVVNPQDGEVETLFKAVQSTQEPVATLQDEGIEPLSEGKGTKKSLSRKKKDENFGLNASEAPVTSLPVPRQTLAQQLATRPEVRESFLVADEQMSLFLGALEKKTKDSLVITLTGKQGSGKTRFAFQFMNALAQRYRVGHASIEEHPESVLYEEKAYQYLNDTALEHITAQDVRSLAELDTMIRTNEVIVIDSFQKMRELEPKFEVDKDLRKKYDGKLFLVIFQQTADGKMRGGSKSQFDGDIILFTETFPDYRENYVYPDKNRYNKRPATELQYSIYEQRMLATAPEVPALPAHYEPTESEELNFEVL